MMQLKGRYPAPPGAPQDIPGLELAGEVVAVGPGVQRFEPGDRVMSIVAGGAQAELAVVHERTAMPVPPELEWEAAGGVPEVFTTAHDALFTQAGLRAGERLLVHGAAGGVGMAGVQLGQMAGARVTATVRNPDSRERIDALDVKAIEPEGFEEHGPFDVILELVGAPNLPGNVAALATGGRIVVIGIGAGAKSELDLRGLMGKRGSIHASTLRSPPARGEGADRALRRALGAPRLHLRRPQRAGLRDLPARRRGRGLRAIPGRGQARQDRAAALGRQAAVSSPGSSSSSDSAWCTLQRLGPPDSSASSISRCVSAAPHSSHVLRDGFERVLLEIHGQKFTDRLRSRQMSD